MALKNTISERYGMAKEQLLLLALFLGLEAEAAAHGAQEWLADMFGIQPNPEAIPSAFELGIFMVLVFGSVALVVVSIVLLFGMDIAGEFAEGIEVDNAYSDEANATVNSTGNAFELFGTSVLVIPAAAVLAVLIGGLIGAVTMVGGGEQLPGAVGPGGR